MTSKTVFVNICNIQYAKPKPPSLQYDCDFNYNYICDTTH